VAIGFVLTYLTVNSDSVLISTPFVVNLVIRSNINYSFNQ